MKNEIKFQFPYIASVRKNETETYIPIIVEKGMCFFFSLLTVLHYIAEFPLSVQHICMSIKIIHHD